MWISVYSGKAVICEIFLTSPVSNQSCVDSEKLGTLRKDFFRLCGQCVQGTGVLWQRERVLVPLSSEVTVTVCVVFWVWTNIVVLCSFLLSCGYLFFFFFLLEIQSSSFFFS